MNRDRTPDEIMQQNRGRGSCGVVCLLLMLCCGVATGVFLVGLAFEPLLGVER